LGKLYASYYAGSSFLRTEKGNSVLDHDGVAHLESLLSEVRPAVLVLDPLVVFCGGGNLNDNAAMSLVLRALKRLANRFDCAILILHHTRKGGDLGKQRRGDRRSIFHRQPCPARDHGRANDG
jgi:RecA-family ATPase